LRGSLLGAGLIFARPTPPATDITDVRLTAHDILGV
jgi:hypothetical protein